MVFQIRCVEQQFQFHLISLKVKAVIQKKILSASWLRQEALYGSYLRSWIFVKGLIILINRKQKLLMA